MNDKRAYYYPVLAYVLLFFAMWVLSWLIGVLELLATAEWGLNPLVSAEGVRWAIRNSLQALNDVPWGTVVIVIAVVGFLRGSGLKKAIYRLFGPERMTENQKRASMYALFALLCSILIISMTIVSPWNLLLGVSGGLTASPLLQGWLILLFFCVAFISMTYGFIYGNYRSAMDVVCSLGDTFVLSVPALIAIVPAAGIISGLEYTGVFMLFDMQSEDVAVFADVIFAIPFLYIILLRRMERNENIENSLF